MSGQERRGASILVLALLATAALRLGFRDHGRVGGFPRAGGVADSLLAASAAALDDAARRSRPLAPGEILDPNAAEDWQLDRLPGVGPALAAAIVVDRDARGPFRSMDDLARVRGIGPSMLDRLGPHLNLPSHPRAGGRRDPPGSEAVVPSAPDPPSGGPLDLNRADPETLQRIPGVGPKLARRIADSRTRDGPFRSAADLERVSGIGPATAARIWAFASGKSNS
jgi:competence ComEA-like helix-hairpin-helix protein